MSPVEELYTKVVALLPDEVLREHGQAILMESLRLRAEEKNRLKDCWRNSRLTMGTSQEFEDYYDKVKQR